MSSRAFIPQFLVLIWMKRLMPPGKRHRRDVYFVAFVMCTLLFLPPIAVAMQWLGLKTTACSCAIGWCLTALSLVLWWRNCSLVFSVLLFECTLLTVVLFNALQFGGVVSPMLVWLGIVPLLPFFIARRIWCYAFLVFSFCAVIAIFVLQLYGYIASPPGTSSAQIWIGGLMYSIFVVTQMILIVLVDASNLLRLRKIGHNNERLRALTQALEQAGEHKERFLFSVSHEMRTPLNAIYGFLELLRQREDLPAVALTQIGYATSSAAHLLTIINDLLDYSQIRQGGFSLALQSVDLPPLLEEIHQILQEQAARKPVSYTWKAITPLPSSAQVDPHRLTQILLNLLGNAIKFTHNGEIRMEVSYHAQDAQRGELELHVIDTGIGIPAMQLEYIFEPFVRLGPATAASAAQHGNGLGLAITRGLVQAWGGQISAHNRPEGGSQFIVRLPITVTPRGNAADEAPHIPIDPATRTSRAYDFLLVDDHAMNRLVAHAVIQQAFPTSRIDEAQDGKQALEKMATHTYDLVLMDIVMHDLSGIDVVRTVRDTLPEPYSQVPVIALTANLAADIAAQCQACGIAAVVPKPLKADILTQVMKKHARDNIPTSPSVCG